MNKLRKIFVIFAMLAVASVGCSESAPDSTTQAPAVQESTVTQVSEKPSDAKAAMPKVIDFGSKQCKACKAMEPVLESLMKNHADKFITEFVDVWMPENVALAKSHGISSIPTQVFFGADGKELFRNTGFISEEQILAKWQELGVTFAAGETKAAAPVATTSEKAQPTEEKAD